MAGGAATLPQLPTVTIDDLRHHHASHFPDTEVPYITVESLRASDVPEHDDGEVVADGEYEDEDDDELGHYADGVKRTLTDDQIAMFRHSEIQALLRERRRQQEALDEGDSTGEPARNSPKGRPNNSKRPFLHSNSHDANTRGKKRKKYRKPRPAKGERANQKDAAEDELMEHHKARMLASLGEADTQGKNEDYTPRRLARELDEVEHTNVEVDYG